MINIKIYGNQNKGVPGQAVQPLDGVLFVYPESRQGAEAPCYTYI